MSELKQINLKGSIIDLPSTPSGEWVDVPFTHNFPSWIQPIVKSNGSIWLVGFYFLQGNQPTDGEFTISNLPTNYFMIKEDNNVDNKMSSSFYSYGMTSVGFSIRSDSIVVSISSNSSRAKALHFGFLPYSPTEI